MNKNNFTITKSKDKQLAKQLKTDPIFKEQTRQKCLDFIKMLSFDINKEVIYAFIDRDQFNKIDWRETVNFTRNKIKFNFDEKKCEMGSEYFTIEDNILNHSFALELKKRTKFKPKAFYCKDKDDQTLIDMSYCNNSMIGGYLKETSNILCVDIDCHKGEGSLYTYQIKSDIINFMKVEPIYMEISSDSGYHLYFKLNKEMTLYEKKSLLLKFKEKYGHTVELPIRVRLPNSVQYTPVDSDGEIYSYLNAIDRANQLYNSQRRERQHVIVPNVVEETIPREKPKQIPSSIYSRKFKSKTIRTNINEFIKNPTIEISSGNRVLPMLNVIRIGKINNWSIDEICRAIYACNNKFIPSKDLSNWSYNTLYRQVESTYKRCKINPSVTYDSYKPEQFISNVKHIPSHILSKIDKKFIKTIIQQVQSNSKEYKTTKKNIKSFSIIFKEMIGYMYYNAKNNKTIKHEFYTKYLIGMQYSLAFASALEEHYKDELNKTDVWGIVNSILKHSKFFTQYKVNTRGWYFNPEKIDKNFCRQFDIYSNTKHKLLNDKQSISFILFNSINNYIKQYCLSILNKVNQLHYNIITLYIEYFGSIKEYFNQFNRGELLLLYDS